MRGRYCDVTGTLIVPDGDFSRAQLLETRGVVVGDEVKISIDSQVVTKPA